MYRILVEEKEFSIVMLVLFCVSIFIKVLLGWLYAVMIKEADNMATTENKILKQCKSRFANCYQMAGRVPNVSVFVDKFICKLTLGPCSFDRMYRLSGQAMLLAVVAAGLGVLKGILDGKNLGQVFPFYILSFWALYLYFSISTGVDIVNKKKVLKVHLMDYLENHYIVRMDMTKEETESKPQQVQESIAQETKITKEELEALLEEFLAVES